MSKQKNTSFLSRTSLSSYDMEKLIQYNYIKSTDDIEKKVNELFEKLRKKGMDLVSIRIYLQGYINDYITKMIKDIERQRNSHYSRIKQLFVTRSADKKELEELLERLNKQIDLIKIDYSFVENLYKLEKQKQEGIEKIVDSFSIEEDNDFETV